MFLFSMITYAISYNYFKDSTPLAANDERETKDNRKPHS